MEKEVITTWIKKILLKIAYWGVSLLIFFNAMIILNLHLVVPFFPVLFLFDLCLIIGYPMFLRYVLKKKWFECCKNKLLQIKYILLPILLLEILALFVIIIYYTNEILQASQMCKLKIENEQQNRPKLYNAINNRDVNGIADNVHRKDVGWIIFYVISCNYLYQ